MANNFEQAVIDAVGPLLAGEPHCRTKLTRAFAEYQSWRIEQQNALNERRERTTVFTDRPFWERDEELQRMLSPRTEEAVR